MKDFEDHTHKNVDFFFTRKSYGKQKSFCLTYDKKYYYY